MLLRFNQQVRIAEDGIHVRHFEKGGEYDIANEVFANRILEIFPDAAVRIKREDPVLTTKKLVIKSGGKSDEEDEEE